MEVPLPVLMGDDSDPALWSAAGLIVRWRDETSQRRLQLQGGESLTIDHGRLFQIHRAILGYMEGIVGPGHNARENICALPDAVHHLERERSAKFCSVIADEC